MVESLKSHFAISSNSFNFYQVHINTKSYVEFELPNKWVFFFLFFLRRRATADYRRLDVNILSSMIYDEKHWNYFYSDTSKVLGYYKRKELSTAQAIDCFKCVSMNGKFPPCDDPFHNNHSLQMLEASCMGGRKGRDGLFPATSCIKIAGVFGEFCNKLFPYFV